MQYTIEVSDSLVPLLELIAKSHGVSVKEWIKAWLEWWVESSRGQALDKTTAEELKGGEEFRTSVASLGLRQEGGEAHDTSRS